MNSKAGDRYFSARWLRANAVALQRVLRTDLVPLAAICIRLALTAAVLRELDILTPAFRRTFYVACAAFLVNHFLPARLRLSFFVLLCFGVVLLVMGGSPESFWDPVLAASRSGVLIASAAVLIGACMLPIAFWLRVAIVALLGVGVALLRKGAVDSDPFLMIWPVLASFFMFRIIVFLYDLATWKARPGWRESVAYFFLFPNVCSTLFPVVDFKTMCRAHYDSAALEIYERGTRWIGRGVLQLVAYRLVKQLLSIEAGDVATGAEVIQYILSTTLAYLQVSGLFHLVVGMLLLFGFNLPETHKRYFLAASFTDYWRRVNIYWKDFILKVFYYPIYFRLKAAGPVVAMAVATAWAFTMTWALHLYQTWWLTGSAHVKWTDSLFWSTLALLVLINSLWELKRGRRRTLLARGYDTRSGTIRVLKTVATFACISVMWSMWSTPELSTWLGMLSHADGATAALGLATLLTIAAATLYCEVLPAGTADRARQPSLRPDAYAFVRNVAPLAVVLILASGRVPTGTGYGPAQMVVDALHTGDSMTDPLADANRGYYENLLAPDAANAQLWETLTRREIAYVYSGQDPVEPTDDFRFRVPLPNVDVAAYDTRFVTNRWGLRDGDYALQKPPRTVRIALLGSSHTMGWGIAQAQTFAARVERRLNAEPPAGIDGVRFEVLNFAFNGLSSLGQIAVFEKEVAKFHPDFALYVMHPVDYDWAGRDVARALREGRPIEDPSLRRVVAEARIGARTHKVIAERRLEPYEPELLRWSYTALSERLQAHGIEARAMLVPLPDDLESSHGTPAGEQARIARDAGFGVYDALDIYAGMKRSDVVLPEGWHHTNTRGHKLIAERLYQYLSTDASLLDAMRRAALERPEAAASASQAGD